jgi:short-subunit dehydrogenase involved in D-alanine esterification of teichoic acids
VILCSQFLKFYHFPQNAYIETNLLSSIADSVVVITGASSGMGRELTFKYAERGCKIVIGSRNIKELEAVSLKIT